MHKQTKWLNCWEVIRVSKHRVDKKKTKRKRKDHSNQELKEVQGFTTRSGLNSLVTFWW